MSERSEGEQFLDEVWWSTIAELQEIIQLAENTGDRVKAADVLLRYYVSLGQSINEPYIPESRAVEEDPEDE